MLVTAITTGFTYYPIYIFQLLNLLKKFKAIYINGQMSPFE